jgi:cathepsin L
LKGSKPIPENFVVKPLKDLPTSVDWRSSGAVSTVKDQGHCGSCWAFASTATIESHVALATGLMFDLSVQQMAMCAPNPDHCGGIGQCEGSTAELAFDYVTGSDGMYQEYQYPYESYYGTDYDCRSDIPKSSLPVATIDGYVKLPDNNYTMLMNAVANVGPVAINVDASTWHAYESGVFNGCNQDTPDVNHVVVTIGYGTDETSGEKYWIVRNSWSANFGEAGFIRLLRTDEDESNCGSDVTPQDGVACQDQVDPLTVCGTCGAIYDSSYPLNAQLSKWLN